MSKFKVGDRVIRSDGDGAGTVINVVDNEWFDVLRDDGQPGLGVNRSWGAYADNWRFIARNPILDIPDQVAQSRTDSFKDWQESIKNKRRLQAIYIASAAMIEAIDEDIIGERYHADSLYGTVEAFMEVLGELFSPDTEINKRIDERVLELRQKIASGELPG